MEPTDAGVVQAAALYRLTEGLGPWPHRGKVAAVGYCFGGLVSYMAAARGLVDAASLGRARPYLQDAVLRLWGL